MGSKRTFIAIDISPSARAACESHIRHLRRDFPDVRVRWERPEKLHITLKFLGATDTSIVADLQRELAEVASRHAAFTLCLSKTGLFPSKSKPRILWIGLDDANNSTAAVHRSVESACARFGFEIEKREFRPHLTIARIREPNRAKALAESHLKSEIEAVEFDVTELVFYESRLQPSGSIYSALFHPRLKS